MKEFDRFVDIIRRLRAKDGCPWDREQTHESLKAPCIEEAAEVICGINIFTETGNSDNLREELGDLLMQVVMHSVIAEEEGLFTMEDVVNDISNKMIRRHPHVFGDVNVKDSDEVLVNWEKIKDKEKKDKATINENLPAAMEESKLLIDKAMERKRKKELEKLAQIANSELSGM